MNTHSAGAASITANWLNAADGNWDDPVQWDSANFPNNNGDSYTAVVAATGASYTVTLDSTIVVDDFTLNASDATLEHTNGNFQVLNAANLLAGTFHLNGGAVVGGTWSLGAGDLSFGDDDANRLDAATVQGDLNLNAFDGSRVRLLNGASFTGNADLGDNAILAMEDDLTVDHKTLSLNGTNARLGPNATHTLTLGPNALIQLNGSGARLSSDVINNGTGVIINQGAVTADGTTGELERRINPDIFDNRNLVEAVNGATLTLTANSDWSNSGTYRVDGTSTLNIDGTLLVDDLGAIDNTANGTVNLRGTVFNGILPGDANNDNKVTGSDLIAVQQNFGKVGPPLNGTLPGDANDDGLVTGADLISVQQNFGNVLTAVLTLNASTGIFTLDGARIVGGNITQADGAFLAFADNDGNRLDSATVQGDLNLNTGIESRLRLLNGATFTGDADLGQGAILAVESDLTLDNKTINLSGSNARFGNNFTSTLTLGPGAQVNLTGSNSSLRSDVISGGTGTIINQGTVTADGGGAARRIRPDIFQNQGTVEVVNGGSLTLEGKNGWTNAGTYRVDASSVLQIDGTFTTDSLGAVDNTAGGRAEIHGTLDNSADGFGIGAATGDFTLEGGVIVGGNITQADGAMLSFANDNDNRLNSTTLQGDLNLNTVNSSRVRLQNGATFTGNANLGQSAILAIEDELTLDNKTINLNGSGARFGPNGTHTLTLGPGAQVTLSGSATSLRSDVISGGIGTIVNQGTVTVDGTSGGSTRRIQPDVFNNQGIVEVVNAATLFLEGDTGWANTGTYRIDGSSVLQIAGSFTTASLGAVDNTAGGTADIRATIDNTSDTFATSAATGDFFLNGGTIRGGDITEADGAVLGFSASSGNRLNGATFVGDLNLNTINGSRLRLLNGSTFTGDANLGTNARLAVEDDLTLDSTTINLIGTGAAFGPNATHTLTLGPSAQVNLNGSATRLRSDVINSGTGTIINQGTVTVDGTAGGTARRIQPDIFNNQGTVEAVNGATLTLTGAPGWTNTGTYQIDATSVLEIAGTFTTVSLGAVDNTSGGTAEIQGTLDNTADTFALSAATGDFILNGGVIVGGSITEADGAILDFAQSNSNRLNAVNLPGNLNLNTIDGSRVRLQNGTTFPGDANLGLNAILAIEDEQTLDNKTINLSGTNAVFGPNGTNTLTLGPNAQVNLSGSATRLRSDVISSGTGTIINQGTVTVDGTAGGTTRRIQPDILDNQGTIQVQNGATLSLIGKTGWINTGTYQIDATSVLQVDGTFTTAALGDVDNTAGGTVQIRSTLDNAADTFAISAATGNFVMMGGSIVGGNITQADGAILEFADDTDNRLNAVTVGGGLNLNTVDGSGVRLVGGATFSGDATLGSNAFLAVEDDLTLDNTTIDLNGSDAVFGPNGTHTLTLGPNVQVNLNASDTRVRSDIVGTGTGTLIHQGTITADGTAGGLSRRIEPDIFTNQGTVEVVNGATLTMTNTQLTQQGVLFVEAGSTLTRNATLTNSSGGTVSGGGNLNVTLLDSSGTVAPGASAGGLTISGDYIQQTDGNLAVELGGLVSGSEYDVLTVTGTAALDGTLDVNLINSFAPSLGNTFTILTATGGLGGTTFATEDLPGLSAGLAWSTNYAATSVSLEVVSSSAPVPEPGTLILCLAGCLGALRFRSRTN